MEHAMPARVNFYDMLRVPFPVADRVGSGQTFAESSVFSRR